MRPLPEHARISDVEWIADIHLLAQGLIIAGARAKIVERYTLLSHQSVSKLSRAILNETPKSGPLQTGSVKFYLTGLDSKRSSGPAWNLQCSLFLECYQRLTQSLPDTNKGWRLLHAFNAYLEVTEKLHKEKGVKRLDINQCYSLLTYTALGTAPEYAVIDRTRCRTCDVIYLVAVERELDTQKCPLCSMEQNHLRLVEQGDRKKAAANSKPSVA